MPGQTRPLSLFAQLKASNLSTLNLQIHLESGGGNDTKSKTRSFDVKLPLTHRSIYEPHKATYMHPSGIISYAIFRAPSQNASCGSSAPVLLQLHGAGVETDSEVVRHTMDPLPYLCAFVVFASGVTPWSGDDWRKQNHVSQYSFEC